MKSNFDRQYIIDNKGCYSDDKVLQLSFLDQKEISLEDIADEIPTKDLSWFFINACELTNLKKQMFAIFCAKLVLTIFEDKYPEDKRPRAAIEEAEKLVNGESDLDKFLEKRRDAAAAAADAAADAADEIKDKIKEYILNHK